MNFSTYATEWLIHRRKTVESWRHDHSRIHVHILPHLASLDMAEVRETDIETIVAHLDNEVLEDRMAWTTAERVWACLTKLFDDAAHAKQRELRVLPASPCVGVRGPDKGSNKTSQYLFPDEFRRLMASPLTPNSSKIVYAVATYTGLRAGELAALLPRHIDLDRSVIHVEESIDVAGDRKGTKSGKARVVPIEPELWPLLARLDDGWLANFFRNYSSAAHNLRHDLQNAGVRRAALFDSTKRSRHIVFHDLRATYLTWCVLRGDAALAIQARAGHSSMDTTLRYIRAAESLPGQGLAEAVFPAIVIPAQHRGNNKPADR